MNRIEIITNKSDLEGTCYIELSPGKYQGKHWQDTSLFFDEEVFGLIETIFEKHVPGFSHYSANDVDTDLWSKVISDLEELNELLFSATEFDEVANYLNFMLAGSEKYFEDNFLLCKKQLSEMIIELLPWAKRNIKEHNSIAVLGM